MPKTSYSDLPESINTKEKFDTAKAIIGRRRVCKPIDYSGIITQVKEYLHPDIIKAGEVLYKEFGDTSYLLDALEIYLVRNIEDQDTFVVGSEHESFDGVIVNVRSIFQRYADSISEFGSIYDFKKHYIDCAIIFAKKYDAFLSKKNQSIMAGLGKTAKEPLKKTLDKIIQIKLEKGEINHMLCHIYEWLIDYKIPIKALFYSDVALGYAEKSSRDLSGLPPDTKLPFSEKKIRHVHYNHYKGIPHNAANGEKNFIKILTNAENQLESYVAARTMERKL